MRQGILFPGGSRFKLLVFKNRDRQNIKEQIKDKSVITLSFLSSHRRGWKIPVSYKKSIEMDYSFIVNLSSINAFLFKSAIAFPSIFIQHQRDRIPP